MIDYNSPFTQCAALILANYRALKQNEELPGTPLRLQLAEAVFNGLEAQDEYIRQNLPRLSRIIDEALQDDNSEEGN